MTASDRLKALYIEVPEVEEPITVEVVESACGLCLVVDDTRVAGGMVGIGHVVKRWKVPPEDMCPALDALVTVLEDRLVFEAGMLARADSLRAEVERLKWMLDEAVGVIDKRWWLPDKPTDAEVLADLARRWQSREEADR